MAEAHAAAERGQLARRQREQEEERNAARDELAAQQEDAQEGRQWLAVMVEQGDATMAMLSQVAAAQWESEAAAERLDER